MPNVYNKTNLSAVSLRIRPGTVGKPDYMALTLLGSLFN